MGPGSDRPFDRACRGANRPRRAVGPDDGRPGGPDRPTPAGHVGGRAPVAERFLDVWSIEGSVGKVVSAAADCRAPE